MQLNSSLTFSIHLFQYAPMLPVRDCIYSEIFFSEYRFCAESNDQAFLQIVFLQEPEEGLYIFLAYPFPYLNLDREEFSVVSVDYVNLLFLWGFEEKPCAEGVYEILLQHKRNVCLRVQRKGEGCVAEIKPFYLLLACEEVFGVVVELLQEQGIFQIGDIVGDSPVVNLQVVPQALVVEVEARSCSGDGHYFKQKLRDVELECLRDVNEYHPLKEAFFEVFPEHMVVHIQGLNESPCLKEPLHMPL